MHDQPLVSVLIPCYNAEKYIEQALRSIMNQSYSNLEIIAADDCSTDNTLKILTTLASEDTRIRIVRNETNLKIVKTLNSLIDSANGKYIARMDSDDISLPDRILKQVTFMEKHPDYAICGVNSYHIDKDNRIIDFSFLPISNCEIQKYKIIHSPFYHPGILIKSEVLKSNKYDESYLYAEDYELWIRLLKSCKARNLRQYLLGYRVYAEQTSTQKKDEQLLITKKILQNHTALNDDGQIDFLLDFINHEENVDFNNFKRCFKNGLPHRYLVFAFRLKKTKNFRMIVKNCRYIIREIPYLLEFYLLKSLIMKKRFPIH